MAIDVNDLVAQFALVEVLRAGHQYSGIVDPVNIKAANMIEQMGVEIARLRAALTRITNEDYNASEIAQLALAQKEPSYIDQVEEDQQT
jgi:hypothetical protein